MKEIFAKDSLQEAINEAHEECGEVTIILSEGRYEIDETIEIKRNNITIRGQGENTIITGSKKIQLQKSDDKIICIDLKKYGILNYGTLSEGPYRDFWLDYEIPKPTMRDYGAGLELFYNDTPMPIVRYPKKGFMKIKKALGTTVTTDPLGKPNGVREGIFIAEDEKVKTWGNEKDLLLVGYWKHDWALQRHSIEKLNPETGEIKVKEPYHYTGYRDGANFYAINVLSELDMPGEWFLNREEGKLYIYPYENQNEICVSVADDIFVINGKENIVIENVCMEQSQGSGVIINNAKNIQVKNCVIKNLGAWAVIAENSYNITISGCLVYGTGGGGISLTGGDRNSLTPSQNKILNNTIHDIARWHRVYLPALQVCGVGGLISGNKIYDVPHFGIVFHGNNHIIEKNEIDNACYESNDAGAIYSGKDWTCRGNVFRYNYIHNLKGFENKGCIGLYFDDALSSAEVYQNIFANISRAILVGGGRDFKIHDNVFYNCKRDIAIDDRLDNWAKKSIPKMKERLFAVDYQNEIWRKSYPELTNILDEQFWLPENNIVENNLNIQITN